MRHPAFLLCAAIVAGVGLNRPLQAENVTFTVTAAGPNSGTVDVRGFGLCSTTPAGETVTCEYQLAVNATVTISANAPGGSTPGVISASAGSVPADCGLKTTCSFSINEDSTLTMTFDAVTYGHLFRSISFVLAGAGAGEVGADNNRCQNIDPRQGSSCVTSYAAGSLVTLEAPPPAGSLFLGFSDGTFDASGCDASPCVFALNTPSSVTASFAALQSISVAPSSATVTVGQTQNFNAAGRFVNGPDVFDAALPGTMGTWKFRADMLTARFGLAAAALNGQLYALGGVDGIPGHGPLATVEAYDPTSDSWSLKPAMLTSRELLAAAVVDGRLYAIGGTTSGGVPVASTEAFDPIGGWSVRASMSRERRGLGAGVVGGRIYAVGGKDAAGNVLSLLEEYDPPSNSWTTKAPMPTARWSLAAGVVDGILYATGGQDSGGNILSIVEAYDPATNTWTTVAPMPSPRELHAAATIGNQLYVVGGNFGRFLDTMDAYDAADDKWWHKSFMPAEALVPGPARLTERAELAAAVIDGVLYAVGGHQVMTAGEPPEASAILQAFADHRVWETSDAGVATITQSGQARAHGVGVTIIGARTGTVTCAATNQCGELIVAEPANVVPAVTIFGSATPSILEGSRLATGGSFRDSDAQTWTATVDYGDGSGVQPLPLILEPPGSLGPTGSFSLDHTYTDNGGYIATVTVTDSEGASGTARLEVTVTNVSPSVSLPNSATTREGSTEPFACASFHDPGMADAPWTATVDYGDGTGVQVVPAADMRVPGSCGGSGGPGGPTGAFDLAHAYAGPGTFTVTVTVRDKDGGVGSATLSVEVGDGDTMPPVITDATPSPGVLWPPNHRMVEVAISVRVTDHNDPLPTCSIAAVRSNEPVNGLGDGDTASDWSVTGPLTLNLRAERAGGGAGRIYSIEVVCSDRAGNVARTTTAVLVPHDRR